MVDSIRRREFIDNLSSRGGYVDIRNLNPDLRQSFRDAGIGDDDLRAAAGQDMVIRGSEDFGRLFARLDRTDGNTSSESFTSRGRDGSLTQAGRVYQALQTQVSSNRSTMAARGGRRFANDPALDALQTGGAPLRTGAHGSHVGKVQQALLDMGYLNPNHTPQTYDRYTAEAVRRFQRDVGLSVDGSVGEETLGALAATAPPPGQVLERRPEYARLTQDGRVDMTVAIGFDEPHTTGDGRTIPGSHHREEREVVAGLMRRGFRAVSVAQIRAMSGSERQRLGLDAGRLDPNARYFIKDDGAGGSTDTVVRLITPGGDGAAARASFQRAIEQDEVIVYSGHARYGTGPDFDHKYRGAGNFVVDGHGNRSHGRPPAGLRRSIGNDPSRSDLRNLRDRPDYQLICLNGCSTEEYLQNMRNPDVFDRTQGNTDIIATSMPTLVATGSEHTLRFVDGVLNQESNNVMIADQNRIEQDALRGFRSPRSEVNDAATAFTESGFIDNQANRTVPRP